VIFGLNGGAGILQLGLGEIVGTVVRQFANLEWVQNAFCNHLYMDDWTAHSSDISLALHLFALTIWCMLLFGFASQLAKVGALIRTKDRALFEEICARFQIDIPVLKELSLLGVGVSLSDHFIEMDCRRFVKWDQIDTFLSDVQPTKQKAFAVAGIIGHDSLCLHPEHRLAAD
ncbi:hypothetical protein FOL47_005238, partial [Perkinsus chesapeaki]